MKYGVAVVVIIFAVIAASVAMAGTANDRVLKEEQYIEVFKKEGNGNKNYMYTITEFKDKWGRVCTVTTADSEQTIALDCDFLVGGG